MVKGESIEENGYDKKIEENAKKYGYKAANLMYLKDNFTSSEGSISVEVPEFISIEHDAIIAHLNKHASKWKDHWDNFVQKQRDSENKLLSEDGKKDLKLLRDCIVECFNDHPLKNENLADFISKFGDEEES